MKINNDQFYIEMKFFFFQLRILTGLKSNRFDSNWFKIKPYLIQPFCQNFNFLSFLQFLDQKGHEESENHGPETLGIIKRDILAVFIIKCEKDGKKYLFWARDYVL